VGLRENAPSRVHLHRCIDLLHLMPKECPSRCRRPTGQGRKSFARVWLDVKLLAGFPSLPQGCHPPAVGAASLELFESLWLMRCWLDSTLFLIVSFISNVFPMLHLSVPLFAAVTAPPIIGCLGLVQWIAPAWRDVTRWCAVWVFGLVLRTPADVHAPLLVPGRCPVRDGE